MLCAPLVDLPVTPCTRKVRVSNALAGATVQVFENGVPVGKGTASGPVSFVPLEATVTLTSGRRITATQTLDGDTSLPTPDDAAATVLNTPTPAMLGQIISRARLLECGVCLWLEGIVPGASITVQLGNSPPIVVNADWTAVHVDVPSLAANMTVAVQQTACGVTGPLVLLPPSLLQSRDPHGLESPTIETPLFLCQRALTIHVLPGAVVSLEHDGLTEFCFGATRGTFWLDRGLGIRDRVLVRQRFERCELESVTAEYAPSEAQPPAPGFPYPVCAGDAQVDVSGLKTGAHVQFFRDNETAPFAITDAGEPPHRFNLPPLGNATRLGVRQTLCDYGPWSDTTFTNLIAAVVVDSPFIVEPVHACGAAVGVEGLSAGTNVRVSSQKWGGPIGVGVGNGDAVLDVPVFFPLIEGDHLNLETIQCGVFRGLDRLTVVERAPERLPPPEIEDPLDDCGGRIPVNQLVPGAWVDVERIADPNVPANVSGTLIASEPVTRESARVAVPPLQAGQLIRVRQRLCGRVSEPSNVAKVGGRLMRYVSGSTFRICQLTGRGDPAGRPHLFDTTGIDLFGTDLSIPVEHGGALYFFFGDCDEGEDSLADGDPIAWTTHHRNPTGPASTGCSTKTASSAGSSSRACRSSGTSRCRRADSVMAANCICSSRARR